ncbi:MAG: energy transducer TonB [Nitrospiria bacterium]
MRQYALTLLLSMTLHGLLLNFPDRFEGVPLETNPQEGGISVRVIQRAPDRKKDASPQKQISRDRVPHRLDRSPQKVHNQPAPTRRQPSDKSTQDQGSETGGRKSGSSLQDRVSTRLPGVPPPLKEATPSLPREETAGRVEAEIMGPGPETPEPGDAVPSAKGMILGGNSQKEIQIPPRRLIQDLKGGYQVMPRYPFAARREGREGTVILRMKVLADGSVGEVAVERSSKFLDLDDAALDAVKKWQFEPPLQNGNPIRVSVLLPIQFSLSP